MVNGRARITKAAKGLKRAKAKYEEKVWVESALGSDRERFKPDCEGKKLEHLLTLISSQLHTFACNRRDGVVQDPGISDAEAEALVERGTAAKPIWKRVGAKRFLSGGDGAGFLAS
uniref:MADS-box domain-containing protein n=1 Tax=Ascaris lumbricoides TaxID=6252 RepID=A0A0M3HS57_ASCLU